MNQPYLSPLWEQIRDFSLDDATAVVPFSQRLSRQQKWSTQFTQRVITEYKRFLYLCVMRPGGAAPSPMVDEVWHLHMTYTQSYWQRLCRELLQTELHHYPSKGGRDETEKHIHWYRQTLEAYEQTFSEKAPDEIWPDPDKVYAAPVIELTPIETFRRHALLYTSITFLLLGVSGLYQTSGRVFLAIFLPYGIISLIWLYILMRIKRQTVTHLVNTHFPANANPFQLAAFVYGSNRTCQMALVELTNQGILSFDGQRFWVQENPDNPSLKSNPLTALLIRNFKKGASFSYEEIHAQLDHEQVQHPTLEYLRSWSEPFKWETWWLPGLWTLLSLVRIIQGMYHEKPVSILVASTIIFGFLSFALIQSHKVKKLIGSALLQLWKSNAIRNEDNHLMNQYAWEGPALLGSLLAWPIMEAHFNEANRKFQATSDGGWSGGTGCGSSGCSGGDGGGGCGSGCGGCGGGD